MKTNFTTITMAVFLCIGITAKGEQVNSKTVRLNFKDAKNTLLADFDGAGRFKPFQMAGNQFSVPQFSEDYTWDEESNSWQHVSNTTYIYDGAGRITEEIAREPETDMYLTLNFFAYDEHGNTREENSYVWGSDRWIPLNGKRLVYSRNYGGLFDGIIEQTMENGIWVNQTKIEYTPHEYQMPYPAGMQIYQWDGINWMLHRRYISVSWTDWHKREMRAYVLQYWQNNQWVNAERFSAQYNGDNYSAITEVWNNTEWKYSKQELYAVNTAEEMLTLREWTENGWVPSENYRTTFDSRGNQSAFFYNTWDGNNWSLEMQYFFDLTYNELHDVTKMMVRYWDPSYSVNVSKYVFSNFLRFTTYVPEVSELNDVKVFPNPVGSNFTIQINDNQITSYQVNILNLAGQTIFSNSYSDASIAVNAEGLTPGMYLLNIKSDEGKTYTGKIVKK